MVIESLVGLCDILETIWAQQLVITGIAISLVRPTLMSEDERRIVFAFDNQV
jgi:hypothetical protein